MLGDTEPLNPVEVFLFAPGPELAGDNQRCAGVLDDVGHCLQQNVQALVGSDEAEEEYGGGVSVLADRLTTRFPREIQRRQAALPNIGKRHDFLEVT